MRKSSVCWREVAAALVLGLAMTLAAAARADAVLTVTATDPAPDATLARQEPFYVQFEVKSADSVAVTLDALHRGQPVLANSGTGGMVRLPAGGGSAALFVFYWGEKPTLIDEIRLKVSNPRDAASSREFSLPVKLTWMARNAEVTREPAPWVRTWQQTQEARRRAEHDEYRKRMAQTGPSYAAVGMMFTAVMAALVLAGMGLPLWGALKWRGWWRAAAAAAGAMPLLSLAGIVIGVSTDPTSHNLAPFEIGIWLLLSAAMMAILFAARFLQRRHAGKARAVADKTAPDDI